MKKQILLFITLLLSGCEGLTDVLQKDQEIIFSESQSDEISISSSDTTLVVRFTSSFTWKANVSVGEKWLQVTPSSGSAGSISIVVEAAENSSLKERVGVIVIESGEKSISCTITQSAKAGDETEDTPVVPEETIRYVAFACENFEQYCVKNYDSDADGKISEKEALQIDTIDIADFQDKILSLGGIESFKNLRALNCPELGLGSIDISSNVQLKTFICRGNGLTEIDLSQNTELEFLSISGNFLTELDLSANNKLNYLSCGRNALKCLDLTSCPGLKHLTCNSMYVDVADRNNKLEYIVTSPNHVFSYISKPHETLVIAEGEVYAAIDEIEIPATYNRIVIRVVSTEDELVTRIPEWIIEAGEKIIDEFTFEYVLDVQENTLLESRTGQLVFKSSTGHQLIVRVVQEAGVQPDDYVEFNDKLLEEYCLAAYDMDKNGKIDKRTETLAVTEIRLENVSSSLSLKELVCFPNVETIYISGGHIETIDLSANKNLMSLTLLDNYYGEQIDLSSNLRLRDIFIRHSSLKSLNVSHLSELQSLRCIYSHLSDLDLSSNTKLQTLYCHGNDIQQLDISMNHNLKQLYAKSMNTGIDFKYIIAEDSEQISNMVRFDAPTTTRVLCKEAIYVSSDKFSVDENANVIKLDVVSSENCVLNYVPSWIILKGVVSDDMFSRTYTFEVTANVGDVERSDLIVLKASECGTVAHVRISQSSPQKTETGGGTEDLKPGTTIWM